MGANSIIRKILKAPFLLYLKVHVRSIEGLKYLWFNRKSKVLAIVFSAFDSEDNHRAYNYVKSLSRIPIDFLFLSDPWGFRGSYYMFDKGSYKPQDVVHNLINQRIINRGGYSHVVTLGTSKGGTAALYYGLKCSASDIIIGACQYRIGSYVADYPEIFKGMTGNEVNPLDIDRLNAIMPRVIKKIIPEQTHIHLIHSSKEPTYNRDIKYLIEDLNVSGYDWQEYECGFEQHNDIGKHFIPIAKQILTKLKSEST